MKIEKAISFLKGALDDGYKYVTTNFFGGCSLGVRNAENFGTVRIFRTIFKNEDVSEDIECVIIGCDVYVDTMGEAVCEFKLQPIDQLPSWYDGEDKYSDFECVPISDLQN